MNVFSSIAKNIEVLVCGLTYESGCNAHIVVNTDVIQDGTGEKKYICKNQIQKQKIESENFEKSFKRTV